MKKFKFLLLILVMTFSLIGCSEQHIAKNYGGEMTVYLEPNVKLIEVTWKDDDLWYLTRPMVDNDIVETYNFQEKTSYGVLEGTVVIVESKATDSQLKEYEHWKNIGVIYSWKEYCKYTEHGYTLEDIKSGNIDYSIFD